MQTATRMLRRWSADRDGTVTTSGLKNTAYLILLGVIVYAWFVGG